MFMKLFSCCDGMFLFIFTLFLMVLGGQSLFIVVMFLI